MVEDPQEYLRFDVGSINSLIRQKLGENFPDVNQRGSSAAILTEAVASTFSLLLFQLNRSAANSSFSKTNSLESLINQTKLIGYNPVGHQASSMFVDISTAITLDEATYTIPRYSFIETNNGSFCITEDLTFTNNVSHETVVFPNTIFKGGRYVEHPILFGDGSTNQKFILNNGNNLVDHNSIDVYVREENGNWEQFERVESLFLSSGNDSSFETRFNDRGTYDITFGDGINGCIISNNAEIAIYYISINTGENTLSVGDVDTVVNRFSTNQINNILIDVVDTQSSILLNELRTIFTATNTSESTPRTEPETVDEIKRNAPSTFKAQNRLITKEDYRSFILNNFSDFVSDVLITSNEEFLETYIKYYTTLGLNKPFEESRTLFNQINFSSSCNFNNVYIFMVPKVGNYLSDVQKQLIVESLSNTKTFTSEIIPSDPIYINFGIATPTNEILFSDIDDSGLLVEKSPNTNRSEEDLRVQVRDTIVRYFDEKRLLFDQRIDSSELNSIVLSIDGVQKISTYNGGVVNTGIGLYEFNPSFPDKVTSAPPTNIFTGIFVPRFFGENDLLTKILFV